MKLMQEDQNKEGAQEKGYNFLMKEYPGNLLYICQIIFIATYVFNYIILISNSAEYVG